MSDIATEKVQPGQIETEIQRYLREGEYGMTQLVDVILRQSVWNKVSDIHFEPFYGGLRVRFRIDGIFQDVIRFPKRVHEQLVARVKVMANLLPHKRDIAQEGRISFTVEGQDVDFRVSVVPTVGGERIVIRIFDPMRALFSIDDLGFPDDIRKRFVDLLMETDGLVILTGPSSSGKTTTLYAGLQKIYQERGSHAALVTIEDPVEYELGMFSQIEVNRRVGMDFAGTLGALLRQDPEVIMVGEIRDFETCQIALRASLTGHLILTTIHSGNACEVITRLLDMGMEPFVVSSSIKGVMAVRLIRKICDSCRAPYEPDPRHVEYFLRRGLARDAAGAVPAVSSGGGSSVQNPLPPLGDGPPSHSRHDVPEANHVPAAPPVSLSRTEFTKGTGCADCHHTGFKGRTGICELLAIEEPIRQLVLRKSTTAELFRKARESGFRTLLDCGLDRVADGTTTLEEVRRVLGTSLGKEIQPG